MTFSIVARDPRTGAFGVATATGGPCVGSLVAHARAGVGAVATQGFTTNPFYGIDGLELLAGGETASETLAALTRADRNRERRQCIMIGRDGTTAGWSGTELGADFDTFLEPDLAVGGNLLAGPTVLPAMLAAYKAEASSPIHNRLAAALKAGEAEGGDRRGTMSAAVKVVTTEPYFAIDVRVDWSDTPIDDLMSTLAASTSGDYAEFFERLPTRAEPDRG
jgi:uncharacterized Ntn-hydrolase superfamily protein